MLPPLPPRPLGSWGLLSSSLRKLELSARECARHAQATSWPIAANTSPTVRVPVRACARTGRAFPRTAWMRSLPLVKCLSRRLPAAKGASDRLLPPPPLKDEQARNPLTKQKRAGAAPWRSIRAPAMRRAEGGLATLGSLTGEQETHQPRHCRRCSTIRTRTMAAECGSDDSGAEL
jgi:hypothetical protein